MASAKASIAGMSDCFMRLRIVTVGSTNVISFIGSIRVRIALAAQGAQEPFSMSPMRRFW